MISFDSSAGTGPSQLAVIQRLYPEALSQISQAEQHNLAATHVGSNFTLSILDANSPATTINSCIVGCSTPCTDPNLCDYITLSEDLYADYCVNEQVSNQYGTTSRLDKFFAHGTSFDGGSVTYGDWGLVTGGC